MYKYFCDTLTCLLDIPRSGSRLDHMLVLALVFRICLFACLLLYFWDKVSSVTQASLRLVATLQFQPPKFWDYRWVPRSTVFSGPAMLSYVYVVAAPVCTLPTQAPQEYVKIFSGHTPTSLCYWLICFLSKKNCVWVCLCEFPCTTCVQVLQEARREGRVSWDWSDR